VTKPSNSHDDHMHCTVFTSNCQLLRKSVYINRLTQKASLEVNWSWSWNPHGDIRKKNAIAEVV